MNFSKSFRNTFLVILLSLIVSACATKKTTTTVEGQMQGDVYTGTDTVKYLADGVPDRVFFATNESILTTKSRDTLRKQANWLRSCKPTPPHRKGHRAQQQANLFLSTFSARLNSVSSWVWIPLALIQRCLDKLLLQTTLIS